MSRTICETRLCTTGLVVPSLSRDGRAAEEVRKKSEFKPTHVTMEDVTLSSTNGNPLAKLPKGTKVVSESMDGTGVVFDSDIYQVRTIDGRFSLAYSTSFSRLAHTIPVTTEAKQIAAGSNKFAFDLYRQLRQQDGNLFVSPASISAALAMTSAGAAGATRHEMAKVLNLNEDVSDRTPSWRGFTEWGYLLGVFSGWGCWGCVRFVRPAFRGSGWFYRARWP